MSFDAHANLAYSTVATAPSPATTGTSLVVGSGEGARFPAVPFNATIWPASTTPTPANSEIVRVTGISTDTFTIVRHQEGTSARSVGTGDQIAATITAKTLTDIENGLYINDSPASGAYDEEFTQNSSGVPSGWSSFGANAMVECNTNTFPGSLYIKSETARSSAHDLQGIIKAAPSVGAYTSVTARFSMRPRRTNYFLAGLVLMDGTTTGPTQYVGMQASSSVSTQAFSNWTTTGSFSAASPDLIFPKLYARFIVHAANNIDAQWSLDGCLFETLATGISTLSSASYFGFAVSAYSQQGEAVCDWIRFS